MSIQREIGSFAEVERVWRQNRCLTDQTIAVYRQWIRSFIEYCRTQELDPRKELTYVRATCFVQSYGCKRGVGAETDVGPETVDLRAREYHDRVAAHKRRIRVVNTVRNSERTGLVADPGEDRPPSSPSEQIRTGAATDTCNPTPATAERPSRSQIRLTVRGGRIVVTLA